ncbi:hypothetical protein KIW84_065908 [Lathyrus oleraceus]|uniref:CCHC-type domain-containing protein n=1 Tax=Pisum sativum TaxID=3888 RepID=A0A9D4WE91_PEA|nr:hypothetical protein KIW84_065908 [Pisum sativum]
MSSCGREHREQAQGLFATRGRTNERGQGGRRKYKLKSNAPGERTCFKCGEHKHFKANCPNKRVLFKKQTNDSNNSKGKQQDLSEASYVSNDEENCFSVSEKDHDISEDSKFVISRDDTFDEKSLTALSKVINPNDGDVTISNKQVIEIESEDQSYSNRGQVENPIASEDEEEDEHDHEEVQQKNTHVYNNINKNLWMSLGQREIVN